MSDPRYQELIAVIKETGAVLLRLRDDAIARDPSMGIESKADGTLVSRADYQANDMLLGALARLFPGDAILSEESPIDRARLSESKRTWVIDPLDGTGSFVEGRDDFSILVALCESFVPTFGVMFFPARDILVVAEKGRGATGKSTRSGTEVGTALSVSSNTALLPGRVYIRNFECSRPELAAPPMDSGLAFLKVASGELDGVILRMTTHREWDFGAPMAVLLEAGGVLTDETGAAIRCGVGEVTYRYLIASNGHIHAQLQALIQN